ncbi:DNRLRE domain-containing protein [Saccharicrinis sp. FJH62]|uniref:CBM96 family carbohydrate-binding protein n=1 Tax=Saccharicrinis sp. FJH62 TaxID=3344657 RepID=UPI0035D4AECF
MKNKSYFLLTTLLMIFVSVQLFAFDQSFTDINSWNVVDKPAAGDIAAGTHSLVDGHLVVDMGSQSDPPSDPVKYRGDIQWVVTDPANYITVNPLTDVLLAIKFIGDKPDATLKLELHDVVNSQYIGKYSPAGSVQTTNNNNIYYFTLSSNAAYTGESITLDKIFFTVADNVVDTAYVVDWIATYPSLEALEADKNIKDDGDLDTDEIIIHGIDQSFDALNGWIVADKPVAGDIAAGSHDVVNGHLVVDMGSQSNPPSDPVKYRGDLQFITTDPAAYYVVKPSTDALLAIKFIGDKPDATLKLEFHDAINNVYIGKWSPAGSIQTSNKNSIYYFSLSSNAGYTGDSITLDKVLFTVADNLEDTSYMVDWIATYPNLAALEAEKDMKDDGDADNDENVLYQPFDALNGWYVDDKPAVGNIAAGTHSIIDGHLVATMGSQSDPASDPAKYRGDIKWVTTDPAEYYSVKPSTDVLLAVKFIGDKPDATLKLELHDAINGVYIGKYSPKGIIQTRNNNNIYYFMLTDNSGYAGESILLDKIYFTVADNVVDTSYVVDWLATYSSLEALEADKDVKDDGNADYDENVLYQPFDALNGWIVADKPVAGDIAAGSHEVVNGHLVVDMGSQSNPPSDPVKYRGDLQFITTDPAAYYVVKPAIDSLLAIKFIGDKPDATLKLEFHDAINNVYIGKWSPAGSVQTTNSNYIYYFNLASNAAYQGKTITLDKVLFTVADNVVDTAYVVDWIAVFENMEDLEANKDMLDDGVSDPDQLPPTELMHSYKFEVADTVIDEVGTVNGTLKGTAIVADGALVLDANGDYVSFDGSALDLNSYSAITMEYLFSSPQGVNDGHWNWTSYFGAADGSNNMMVALNVWDQFRMKKDNSAQVAVSDIDDGKKHHAVAVMTDSQIKIYLDGILQAEAEVGPLSVGSEIAYLGNAIWGGDATWMGSIDEFNIYNGELDEATIYENALAYAGPSNSELSDITVSAGTLNFISGITNYSVIVSKKSAIVNIKGTVKFEGTTIVSGEGDVDVSSGSTADTLVVVSSDKNDTTKYIVNFIALDPMLTGSVIGHSSSWGDNPDTYIDAAFDGDMSTFVDAPSAEGYVGLDLGAGNVGVVTAVRYAPRSNMPDRMVGGEIRGANSDDLSDAVVLYTISETPPVNQMTLVELTGAEGYRYIYYYSASGYCNISELEFYGLFSTTIKSLDINVVADTHIHSYSGNVDGNFGSNSEFITKTKTDGSIDRLGLLKFDLGGSVVGTVDSVRLSVSFHNCHNGYIDLYDYSNEWEENVITWNNAPAQGVNKEDSITRWFTSESWHREDAFHSINITEYFNSKAAEQVFSIAFLSEPTDQGYDIHAKESNPSWIPHLEIYGDVQIIADSKKKIAYVTSGAASDPISNMLSSDENLEVDIVDGSGDYSSYDVVIGQESFASDDVVWSLGGSLNLRNSVPMIMNKTWAWKSNKPAVTSTASVNRIADVTVTVDAANQLNPLFSGITFTDNSIQLFREPVGEIGLDVLNGLAMSDKTTLLASASNVTSTDSSIVINDIPAGTQIGTNAEDVTGARIIAFCMNYETLADVTGITSENMTIWRNAVYMLAGLIPPAELYVNEDYIGVAVQEINSNASISVYPSISSGSFTVEFANNPGMITVYNLSGKVVKQLVATTKIENINIIGSGLYIIKAESAGVSKLFKVVKTN